MRLTTEYPSQNTNINEAISTFKKLQSSELQVAFDNNNMERTYLTQGHETGIIIHKAIHLISEKGTVKQVMVLLTVNFGFHVISIFTFYKRFSLDTWFYFDNDGTKKVDGITVIVSVMWHLYYAFVSILVVASGAMLSKHGRNTGVFVHKRLNKTNEKGFLFDQFGKGSGLNIFTHSTETDSTTMGDRCLIGRKTGVTVHKAIYYAKDDKLRLFSQQLQHRTPVATCGLFPFDWTLLYSTFAASVTYLIILIQFDSSSSLEPSFKPNQTQSHHHGH
ncbi:hypothetical protein Bhyg_13912 [Pseudolycoriella hygida]|uniref:Uncharacterized protein n=1 Tax=Pseudolycoriella hygida TaxID=35572 RepID=A0A9Q0MNX7_9DIPT|nr:hypothetical protein Bhyg_13912 [Pseudolycoriella hygida]